MSMCPLKGINIVEVREWIEGEYVFGVNVAVPAERPRMNNYEMEKLMDWLGEKYGRNDWVLEAIEEPA